MPLHRDDPKSVGGYKLVDRLGAGGMGVVYRGRTRSGRDVAVKVVHAQYAEDTVFRTRFRQEIEAVRRVSGAFTAPVIDADPEAGRPWMATQYVPGRSLAQRLRDRGPLQGPDLRRLALGLVEALRDIHRAGVVHRDLKPANVLMAEDGPRVIDFGISRAAENHTLTETGQMIGTPPFMSPEQLTDARTVGPASDVFSLGALLVYATTGRGPFDADSPYLTAYRVVHDEPVLDGVHQPLRSILERCLSKKAVDRPGLDELAQAFAEALPELDSADVAPRSPEGADTLIEADSPGTRRRSRLLRPPLLAGAAGVLAVALTGCLVLGPLWDGGAAERGSGAAVASRWQALPDGWKPWRTSVYATAASGVRKPLGGADAGASAADGPLSCATGAGSVYCAGNGTLPVRVDSRTGKVVWRLDSLPSGVGRERYESTIIGVHKGVLLLQQTVMNKAGDDQTATVVGFDADSGRRLWSYTTNSPDFEPKLVGGLLMTWDDTDAVARSPRDGTVRWRAALPPGYNCDFYDVGERVYAGCSDLMENPPDNVLVAIDLADGTTRRVSTQAVDAVHVGTWEGDLVFVEYADRQELSWNESRYVKILLIDPETGSVRTRELAESPRGEAALVNGVLCFTSSSGQVTGYAPGTGRRLWQTTTTLQQPGAAVPDGGGRTMYVASGSARVAALDVREGTLLWESSQRADQVVGGSPFAALVLREEGALVVVSSDGTVFTLDPAHPDRKPVSG